MKKLSLLTLLLLSCNTALACDMLGLTPSQVLIMIETDKC